MDRTDEGNASGLTRPWTRTSLRGSQSKIPVLLFWLLAAAFLFRIATGIADRGERDTGEGLVRWHAEKAALSTARQTNRPLLYDFTAAWCAPCRRLDSEGWADARIAAVVNESFIPARVVDRSREDGNNPAWIGELERRYSVAAFPTLIVADASGREIARMEGYMGKERLVEFLDEARKKAGR